MSFVAFDIETDGLIEDGVIPNITCMATMLVGEHSVGIQWHSNFATTMTEVDVVRVVDYLYSLAMLKVNIITYNGVAFDLLILYKLLKVNNPAAAAKVKKITKGHYDLHYQHVVTRGYNTSMSSMCKGCNIPSKTLGSGAEAITIWAGDVVSKQVVLDYCLNDTRCLADLYRFVLQHKGSYRVSTSGELSFLHYNRVWTVDECTRSARFPEQLTTWL